VKKTLLFSLFCFFLLTSYSQDREEIFPVSWGLNLNERIAPVELPPINLQNLIIEDSINDLDKTLPWRYGVTRDVLLNVNEDGVWSTLSNGDRIWRIAIKSPRALNLSVNFNNFYLPEGGMLHLYNEDRTEVSRAYSNQQNRPNNLLGSWFVTGDLIWVEYYEPSNVVEQVNLIIGSVIHGYRMGKVNQLADQIRGLNDSGDCNYDINCPLGEDFDSKKNIVKKAVALLTLGNGYLCSASLLNNTSGDKTPYLLTANHCLENSDPSFWSVRFNWMSPNPVCGTGEDSADLQSNFTMSGAALRANNQQSDFALVELYNDVPESWDISFAGWDNSDDLPEFEVGIHHPNGDIMKVCRDNTGAVKEDANETQVWLIGGGSVGTGDGWEIGTTESGSSGSPLFDQEGRIIGQLYAGESFCNGLVNNKGYDIYGRFGVSWDSGTTPETRLKDWLDPLNTGQSTIGTVQNILGIPENQIAGTLDIYPNPASTIITVINSRYPNLNFVFYNIAGQQLMSGSLSNTMNTLNIENLSEGVYFLYLQDENTNSQITKKVIINR